MFTASFTLGLTQIHPARMPVLPARIAPTMPALAGAARSNCPSLRPDASSRQNNQSGGLGATSPEPATVPLPRPNPNLSSPDLLSRARPPQGRPNKVPIPTPSCSRLPANLSVLPLPNPIASSIRPPVPRLPKTVPLHQFLLTSPDQHSPKNTFILTQIFPAGGSVCPSLAPRNNTHTPRPNQPGLTAPQSPARPNLNPSLISKIQTTDFSRYSNLSRSGRPLAPTQLRAYIPPCSGVTPDYSDKRTYNKRLGPGGGTRRLHQSPDIAGARGRNRIDERPKRPAFAR